MKKNLLLVFLFLVVIINAQNPKLIKTVQGTATEPNNDKQENWINNKWNGLFFYQGKGTPTKLCVTDGTDLGTKNIADIGSGAIQAILPAKDFVYVITSQLISFSPYTYQYNIYKTDGTSAGTSLVYTPPNAVGLSNANQFCSNSNSTQNFCLDGTTNILYFNGYDATNGNELWRTDGTSAGTYMLTDIKAGTGGSYPWGFCKIGNDVFFNATAVGYERKLWKTDGTAAGTVQIPVTEPFFIVNGNIGKVGNKMIFYAHNTVDGYETYVSDGTAAGTFMLKDINAGSGNSYLSTVQEVTLKSNNQYCFFIAQNGVDTALWRTDGTSAGTIKLTNEVSVFNGVSSGGYSDVDESGLWLIQYNSNGSGNSEKLFYSDGTIAGTYLAANNLSYAQKLKIYKKAAWFQARNVGSVANVEVWRSGGNQASTNLALDVAPEIAPSPNNVPYSSNPINFFVRNDKLYFFAKTWLGSMGLYEYNGDFTYNGSVAGGNWKDSANWNSMMPPGITDTVLVVSNVPNAINVNGAKAYAGVLYTTPNTTINFTNATDSLFVSNAIEASSGTSFSGSGTLVLNNTANKNITLKGFTVNNMAILSPASIIKSNLTINNNLNLNNNGLLTLNIGNITLAGTNSTINNTANNYIETNSTGKLIIENIGGTNRIGNVLFPIGNGGNYSPVSIINSGTNDAFAARVQPNIYANYTGETGTGAMLSSGVVNATWFITESVVGGSNAQITFQWNGSQEANSFDKNASAVGHYTNGAWNLGSVGAASGSNPYTYSRAGITSFSPFAILNTSALPVISAKLSVATMQNINTLSWSIIATEVQNIIIEKSVNNIDFKMLQTIPYQSTGNYTDEITTKNAYYRLKLIDKNGKISYSNVVMTNSKNKDNIAVYPTIFKNNFIVENSNSKASIQVFTISGVLLHNQIINAGINNISISSTYTGSLLYKIVDENNNTIMVGKLNKAN